MTRDVRSVLRDSAATPLMPLDLVHARRRVQARHRLRYAVAGTASIAVISVVAASTALVRSPDVARPSDPVTSASASASAPPPEPTLAPAPGPHSFAALPAGWTDLGPPPQVRSNAATVWTGRFLVHWGGSRTTGGGTAESDGVVYDASHRTWSPTAPAPLAAREGAAAAWSGAEVLIWGGYDSRNEPLYDGAAYDPARDTWRKLPEAPARIQGPIDVWADRVWVIVGQSAGRDEMSAMTYDPVEDHWESVVPPPINVTTATAVWTGELVLVIGAHLNGENQAPTRTAVGASFDPVAGLWAELPSPGLLPFAVTGGWDGRRLIGWEYGLNSEAYDPNTARWTGLPKVPLQFQECYPSTAAMQYFVFGEYCGQQALFDGRSEIWQAVSRPGFRSFGSTLVAADPVFVLLGRSVETQAVAMLAYRPS